MRELKSLKLIFIFNIARPTISKEKIKDLWKSFFEYTFSKMIFKTIANNISQH